MQTGPDWDEREAAACARTFSARTRASLVGCRPTLQLNWHGRLLCYHTDVRHELIFIDPESSPHCRRRITTAPIDRARKFMLVQLDRDGYVDDAPFIGAPIQLNPGFLEAANRCCRAGVDRIWFRGYTQEFRYSTYERSVNLFVPCEYVEEAVDALRAAELDGQMAKLDALATKLAVPFDDWSALGERTFHHGVDFPCRPAHFLRLLRGSAESRGLRLRGHVHGESVRIAVTPETVRERIARIRRHLSIRA